MHIRWKRVRTKNKEYRYAELVESYRRESDGMPTKKVVANLGAISEAEFENLRQAFEASRNGKRLVVARRPDPAKPQASLQFLDLAVLLEMWRRSGLDQLCTQVLPRGESSESPADVVAALVIHRCCQPGSKLHATRWFPTTALAELLDLSADAFGNSRLHRVLSQLHEAQPEIMRRLPGLYLASSPCFSALFVDITDATFEGVGPALARRGRTKNDVIRQRVGVALVCEGNGYPLAWEVIPGNAAEAPVLIRQMKTLASKPWGKHVPIVADRALGKTAYIRELLDADVPFVTAITRTEFPTYASGIPFGTYLSLKVDELVEELQKDGFVEVDHAPDGTVRTLARDLEVISHPGLAPTPPLLRLDPEDPGKDALSRIHRIEEWMERTSATQQQAAEQLGYSLESARKWGALTKLLPELQAEILEGSARGISMNRLSTIARVPHDEQRAAFDALLTLRDAGHFKIQRRKSARTRAASEETTPHFHVRVVVYFNAEMRSHQQQKWDERHTEMAAYVEKLNSHAATIPRPPAELVSAVERKLRKLKLLTAFEIRAHRVERGDRPPIHQVEIIAKQDEVNRRRAVYGFSVLVANPSIKHDGVGLVRLYRSKDTVEKDFQTIKSIVEMLPVRHREDQKVQAHVTLCVLALLLERLLRDQLEGTFTAEQALERLSPCRLCRYGERGNRAYLVTQLDQDQRAILKKLKMEHLADDEGILDLIQPQ